MQSSTEGYFDPAVPDRGGQNMQQTMQQAPQQQASFAPQQSSFAKEVSIVADSEYPSRPWR
jgi:hypothetical protein